MPAPVTYPDLFNEALDDLAATIATATGMSTITDPRNLTPPCAFIDTPSFTAFNNKIVTVHWPVRLIVSGPGNLDGSRALLNMAAKVMALKVAVVSGRPTTAIVGGAEYASYDLIIDTQAQAV